MLLFTKIQFNNCNIKTYCNALKHNMQYGIDPYYFTPIQKYNTFIPQIKENYWGINCIFSYPPVQCNITNIAILLLRKVVCFCPIKYFA